MVQGVLHDVLFISLKIRHFLVYLAFSSAYAIYSV